MSSNIRRCIECNYKTHSRLWIGDTTCPICGYSSGYFESTHGGVPEASIDEARAEYLRIVRRIEGSGNDLEGFQRKER